MGEESTDPLVIPQTNEEKSIFMAEESTDPLVTPQKNESDSGNLSENSAQNPDSLDNGLINHAHPSIEFIESHHNGDSPKIYSTEKTDSAKISRATVPHYLRASTGSCHDFCKYGKRPEFEEKPWKALKRKGAKPSPTELTSVQITVPGKLKKEKANKDHSSQVKPSLDTKSYSPKINASSDAKTHSPRQYGSSSNGTRLAKYNPSTTKISPSLDPVETVQNGLGILLPSEKTEIQVKEGHSVDDKVSSTEKKTDDRSEEQFSSEKPKPQVKVKPSSSSANPDSGKGKMIASRAYAKKTLAPPIAPLSTKLSLGKITSSKARKIGNPKLISALKGRRGINGIETETSKNEVPEKTMHVIITGIEDSSLGKNPSSSHAKSQSLSSHEADETDKTIIKKNVSVEMAKVQPMKENHKKILRKSKMVVSEDKYKSPIQLKFRTGKVLDVQSDNNIPRRLKFRRARVVNNEPANEFVSKKNEPVEIGKVQPVKENQNKTLRKSKLVVSEDKYRSPIKIIRSVKVAGPTQSDNNIPWRLKFRKVKPAGLEDTKGDSSRRIFRKGAVKNGAVGTVLPSEKVALKHRNVQGKKDAQGLFNNVIEETASKLVESRKSKVKALVGAFESVISLQERKPTT